LPPKQEDVRAGELILDAKFCDPHKMMPVLLEKGIGLVIVKEDGLVSKNKDVVAVKDRQSFDTTSLADL
jgi:hypothetical protein